jgi:predicted nucleic acid-binding protein
MIVFLDANPVIYFIEQPPVWGPKATARIAAFRAAGEQLAVSDLIRMECLVGPLKRADATTLNDFLAFFAAPDVQTLAVKAGVCDRAARIRATYNFKPLDSLHLAAAVEHGCGLFLTADARLARFPDITIEVLA